MDKFEVQEKINSCFEKADMIFHNASLDEDEQATLFFDELGCMFFNDIKTPYKAEDIERVMFYSDDYDYDNNYVKIFFINGDFLILCQDGTSVALIDDNEYKGTDVLRKYGEYFPKTVSIGFKTKEEILQKIEKCLQKGEVWEFTAQKDEDQIADIAFFNDNFVIDRDVETPYTVSDFDYIKFFKGEQCGGANEVIIEFKNKEELVLSSFYGYDAIIYEGKHRHRYLKGDVLIKYRQMLEAKRLGIENDEFVIIDGVLTEYNGDSAVVSIPEGVKYIEKGVFEDFEITEVFFPNTLIEIGDFAFRNCVNLEQVHLNEGLKTIGDRSFCICRNLKSITLPSTLEIIKSAAFYNSGMTSFSNVPDNCSVASDVFKIIIKT